MRQFSIAQASEEPDKSGCWRVEIDGCRERQYTTQWAAIIGAFVAAHESALTGEEAIVVMETSACQVWTFSLMPSAAPAETGKARNGNGPSSPGRGAVIPFEDTATASLREVA